VGQKSLENDQKYAKDGNKSARHLQKSNQCLISHEYFEGRNTFS